MVTNRIANNAIRSVLKWKRPVAAALLLALLCYSYAAWGLVKQRRMFDDIMQRADAIVVAVPVSGKPMTKDVYIVRSTTMKTFVDILRKSTSVSCGRTWATWYTMRIYVCESSDICYAQISVQPVSGDKTNSNMATLIEAASTGERVDEGSIPIVRTGMSILRVCDE